MKIMLVLFAALVGFACASSPVVPISSTVPANVSSEKVATAITKGAIERGWIAKPTGPGAMELVLNVRTHHVVVDVAYTNTNYTITYKDSMNMRYDTERGTIHPKYEKWVARLRQSIDMHLIQ